MVGDAHDLISDFCDKNCPSKRVTLPKTNSLPLKMMVSNRNLRDSRGQFSGAILVFEGVWIMYLDFCVKHGHMNKGKFSAENIPLTSGAYMGTGMSMVLSKWIITRIKVGCKSRK